MTSYHGMSNLRLEVEKTQTGLYNMVQNTDGAKGGWWWQTPVINTSMYRVYVVHGTTLEFNTLISQAAYFTSDFMKVTAGQYVAARFDTVSGTAAHTVRARYEWYNSAQALISSSVQTAGIGVTAQTNYVPAIVAPASTAFVKIRFDLYNGTGTTNPAANATYRLTNVMVTKNNTNSFSTTRTNLISNPSFEVNTTGWSSIYPGSVTIARTTAQHVSGVAALSMASAGAYSTVGAITPTGTAGMPVVGGRDYNVSANFRAATVARNSELYVGWYTSTGTIIGGSFVNTSFTNGSAVGTWTRANWTVTAPTNAAYLSVQTVVRNPSGGVIPNGETHYVDAVMVEQVSTVGTYFDGSTTSGGTLTYAWTGTAGASASTETNTAITYADSIIWQNVLGPTHVINIDREMMNVGTLSAEILDAMLDPSVADTIRPGKAIRLMSYQSNANVESDPGWQSVYEGTITNGSVVYNKNKTVGSTIETRITITATDNMARLANQGESRGIATVGDLSYILEDTGVPWNLNYTDYQAYRAPVVSNNDNASVLDQIAITTQSNLGYAWISRDNVLHAVDSTNIDDWVVNGLTDKSLTSIPVINGGFETTDLSACYFFSGTGSRTTTAPHSGTYALKVPVPVGQTEIHVEVMPVDSTNLKPGHTYKISFWYKCDSAATSNFIYFRAGSWASGLYTEQQLPISNTWKQATELVVQAGADTDNVIYFDLYADGLTAGESLYIDDITVQEASPSYSDINVDYNTDRCINHVTVKWLRNNASTGETEEVIYGPYTDQNSIDAWGVHAATYTIHGAVESSSSIATYAQNILTANATPTVRANSVVLPVKDDLSLRMATICDIGMLVNVEFDTKIDDLMMVAGIHHTITPELWTVEYDFDAPTSVASPTMVPSPISNDVTDGTWIRPTLVAGWVTAAGWAVPAYMRKNGIVYLKGTMINGTLGQAPFFLPPGYRPAENQAFYGTSHAYGRTQIRTDGAVFIDWGGSNAHWALNGISFPAEA